MKTATTVFCILLACAVNTALSVEHKDNQSGGGTISGYLYAEKDGLPVAFANVIVVGTNKGAMSLDDGRFTVAALPVGEHRVKVLAMGHKTIEVKAHITANEDVHLGSLTLQKTVVSRCGVIEVITECTIVDVGASPVPEDQPGEMPAEAPIDAVAKKNDIVAVRLRQNHPNPFNPVTAIRFELPAANPVELKIYNALGQEVRSLVDESYNPGFHQILWDARTDSGAEAASGVYFYRLRAGTFVQTKKMVLLR